MLCSFRGCPIDKALAFSGVHMSLLPYLILVLSRSKTTSYVLIVEDFTLRTSLFELLSSLSPSSVYHLSHESADGDLTGADLHMMHLFHRGVGAFLLIHPEQLPHVASSLSRDEVDPVSPSAMGSRDGLVTTLSGWGFVPVRRVDSPGTFSVRGAIVDVFCYGSTLPLRLEYEGESLRSARTFQCLLVLVPKRMPALPVLVFLFLLLSPLAHLIFLMSDQLLTLPRRPSISVVLLTKTSLRTTPLLSNSKHSCRKKRFLTG